MPTKNATLLNPPIQSPLWNFGAVGQVKMRRLGLLSVAPVRVATASEGKREGSAMGIPPPAITRASKSFGVSGLMSPKGQSMRPVKGRR